MFQAFYSKLFTVPIAKGGILDLKVPNTFLRVKKSLICNSSGQLLFSSAQETICGHQGCLLTHPYLPSCQQGASPCTCSASLCQCPVNHAYPRKFWMNPKVAEVSHHMEPNTSLGRDPPLDKLLKPLCSHSDSVVQEPVDHNLFAWVSSVEAVLYAQFYSRPL